MIIYINFFVDTEVWDKKNCIGNYNFKYEIMINMVVIGEEGR